MSFRIKLGLTYAFVMICTLMPMQSISLSCHTKSLEDVVIDIQSSLANGIRGIEPIHTETQEDCINFGCLTKNITGNKECNLIIFDTRKATKQPNCYLFYCPSEEACPLKPAKGVMTYRIVKDFSPLRKADLPHPDATPKSYYLTGKSSQEVMDPAQLTNQLTHTNILPEATVSQKLDFQDNLGKAVNKSDELSSQLPVSKNKGHLQSSELSLKQKVANVLSENVIVFPSKAAATSQSIVSTTPVPATLQSTIPPLMPSTISQKLDVPLKVTTEPHPTVFTTLHPVSTTTATPPQPPTPTISTAFTATISQPTVTTKTASTTMPSAAASMKVILETVQFKKTTNYSISNKDDFKYSLTFPSSSVDSFAVNKTLSPENGRLGLDNPQLDNVPRNRFHLQFEKWTLVGTLFCGLLFLVIGLILLGRKLSESLQRKKYSRLDYLINGIYVDI
ncbi:MANSC domain-containing protein 1 [Vombatus ursinus]|uniref:MANSC domain-containing protein n=1 Tax=Vombatus ursinus TaxID=29139 RepID=A0A4X2KHT6_VOMUR|nr:MANSC domain-containing protein 1 [Vombatus ursinus]XP_027712166.1 MANSC domain-containing protein 1 [Vombatus ursinus]